MNQLPYWKRLDEILFFPLKEGGVFLLIGMALFTYVVGNFAWFGGVIAGGIFFSFLFNVIKESSQGKERVPAVTEFFDYWDTIIMPFVRGMAALATLIIPLLIYLIYFKNWSALAGVSLVSAVQTLMDPFIFLCLAVGFIYFPIALCLAAINEDLFHVFNPLIGFNLIRKALGPYFALLFSLGVLFVAKLFATFLLQLTVLKIPIPFFPGLVSQFVSIYFYTLGAFLIGLWAYENAEALGYDIAAPITRALPYSASLFEEETVKRRLPQNMNSPIDDELHSAQSLIVAGSLKPAREMFLDMHQRFPEDMRPTEALLQIAMLTGQTQEIGAYATKLIEASLATKDHATAVRIYEEVMKRGPEIPVAAEVLFKLGQDFYKTKELNLALKALLHLGILYPHDPRSPRALSMAADMYVDKLQNPRKGAELFRHLQDCYATSPLADRISASLKRADRLMMKKSDPPT